MRYKLTFIKPLWVNGDSFKEIEEKGVDSQDDCKNVIVITI